MKTEIKVIAFYAQAVDGGSLGKENCGARTDSSSTKVNLVDLANIALAERIVQYSDQNAQARPSLAAVDDQCSDDQIVSTTLEIKMQSSDQNVQARPSPEAVDDQCRSTIT